MGLAAYDARCDTVQANASPKSFVPIEVVLKPEDYKQRIRSLDQPQEQDPGNPIITFRGERRSNQTHVSTTDPDAKLAHKGNGTAAMVGLYGERVDGESASPLGGDQCGDLSRARVGDGGRARLDRYVPPETCHAAPDHRCGQRVFCQAVSDSLPQAPHHPLTLRLKPPGGKRSISG